MRTVTADDRAREFRLELQRDFNGFEDVQAERLYWGQEHQLVDVVKDVKQHIGQSDLLQEGANDDGNHSRTAGPVLATSTDRSTYALAHKKHIGIYDASSQKLRKGLIVPTEVLKLVFSPGGDAILAILGAQSWPGRNRIAVFPLDGGAEAAFDHRVYDDGLTQVQQMVQGVFQSMSWSQEEIQMHAGSTLREGLHSTIFAAVQRQALARATSAVLEGHSMAFFGDMSEAWDSDTDRLLLVRSSGRRGQFGGRITEVFIGDLTGQDPPRLLPGHQDAVMTAAFTPDRRFVFTSCWDSRVRLYDASTAELLGESEGGAGNQSWTAACSPDSRWLAVGNGDGFVRVWDLSERTLKDPSLILPGSEEGDDAYKRRGHWVRAIQWESRPGGDLRLWYGNDQGIRVYSFDAQTPSRSSLEDAWLYANADRLRNCEVSHLESVEGGGEGIARLAIPLWNGHTSVYDFEHRQKWTIEQSVDPEQRKASGGSAAWILQGRQLALIRCDRDGQARIWQL